MILKLPQVLGHAECVPLMLDKVWLITTNFSLSFQNTLYQLPPMDGAN